MILNGNLQGTRPNRSLRMFPASGHVSKTLLLALPVLTSVTQKRRICAQVSRLSQEQLTDLNGCLIKTLPNLPVAKVVSKKAWLYTLTLNSGKEQRMTYEAQIQN